MSEKIFKGRIIQKHDVEANWIKAVNFIPKKGEMIVYDKDNTHNYERLKIGDGSTLVNSLPFLTDSVTSVSNANHATTAGSATQDSKGNVIDTTYETKTDASLKLADAKDYTDAQIEKVLEGTVANATTAESSTKATQDASGNVITTTYETKTDASAKLTEAKGYTDSEIAKIKSGTVANAGHATSADSATKATQDSKGNVIDTTYETKADATVKLNTAKSYTDSEIKEWVGTTTVATQIADAIDDITPDSIGAVDTSEFSTHINNGNIHVTADDKDIWSSHVRSKHAPSDAEPNRPAFSSILVTESNISTFAGNPETNGVAEIIATTVQDSFNLVGGDYINLDASIGDTIIVNVNEYLLDNRIMDISESVNTDTTYTFATGDNNGQIKVTPLNGSAQNVSVKGLGSAAYTASTEYDAAGSANTALANAKSYTDTQINTIKSGTVSNATTAGSATKATQDSKGNVIDTTYETKSDASAKLTEAKGYTDSAIEKLMNNPTEAIDSIYELRDAMTDNADAITALQGIAGSKANASDLTSHINNKNNPHGVTLAQLGVTVSANDINSAKSYTDTQISNAIDAIPAETMIVNVTLDGTTYTADKTGVEIKAAIDAGKFVYVVYNKEIYYVTHCKDTNIHFQYQKVGIDGVISKLLACAISSNRWAYGDGNFMHDAIATKNTNSTLTTTDKTLVGAINELDSAIENITNGTTEAKKAEHATSADTSTKATQDAGGNVIADTYETKTDASLKLADSKDYTDSQIEKLIESQIQPLLERIEELEAKLKTAVFVG